MEPSNPLRTRPRQKTCRQVSKPLMERRRRARINSCLGDLRTLLLQSQVGKSCCRSKMEKADVLELAVRHLKALTQAPGPTDPAVTAGRFCAGYADCVQEVSHFLAACDGIHSPLGVALLSRLSARAAALARASAPRPHEQRELRAPLTRSPSACPDGTLRSPRVITQPSCFSAADFASRLPQQPYGSPLLGAGDGTQAATKVRAWARAAAPARKAREQSGSTSAWRPW